MNADQFQAFMQGFQNLVEGLKAPEKEKKKVKEPEASTTAGFIKDTYRDPFINHFIPPKVGNIGKFVPFSSVPEDNWLHGFPHKKSK